MSGETSYLTKISGIGRKVADKIVLELKDKVAPYEGEVVAGGASASEVDAIEALKALGYTHKESRDALEEVPRTVTDPGEKVKAALRVLGK
jgi:Holliday junction DNA helicase RuvA